MKAFPLAKFENLIVMDIAGAFVIQERNGAEIGRLDRVTALVWQSADGNTSIEDIARALRASLDIPADSVTVWLALLQRH